MEGEEKRNVLNEKVRHKHTNGQKTVRDFGDKSQSKQRKRGTRNRVEGGMRGGNKGDTAHGGRYM